MSFEKKVHFLKKKKYTRPWPRQPDWYIYTHSFLKRYSFMILEKVHIFQKKNLKKYGFFQKSKSQKSPLPPPLQKIGWCTKQRLGPLLGCFLIFANFNFYNFANNRLFIRPLFFDNLQTLKKNFLMTLFWFPIINPSERREVILSKNRLLFFLTVLREVWFTSFALMSEIIEKWRWKWGKFSFLLQTKRSSCREFEPRIFH